MKERLPIIPHLLPGKNIRVSHKCVFEENPAVWWGFSFTEKHGYSHVLYFLSFNFQFTLY